MEMKSLTLNGKTYDSFVDKDAVRTINGTAPDANGNVVVETGGVSDEQVSSAVSSWLDEHPEATTTVPDGSINPDKTTWMRQVWHNIFNKDDSDFQDGYFFFITANANTTGGGTANYFVSGYIPVAAGKQYYFNFLTAHVKVYDSNKTYLSTVTAGAKSNIVEIPEGAAYMRFSVQKTIVTADTAQVFEYMGEVWEFDTYKNLYAIVVADAGYSKAIADLVHDRFADGTLAPADLFADESVLYKQMKGWAEFHWNIVDPDKLEDGTLNENGDAVAGTNTTFEYYRTPFLPVVPGESIVEKGNYTIFIYDADKKLLQSGNALDIGNPMIMPENAAYIRSTTYGYPGTDRQMRLYRNGYGKNDFVYGSDYDYGHGFPVFKDEDSKEGFKAYLNIHPWADKNFSVIGDSFTAPNKWQSVMCNNLKAGVLKNHAISGGAFSDYDGVPKTAYEQAQEMVTNGENPDVILITLGTNDAGNKRSIGDIVESNSISDFDLTTYTGGMQACLNYLQNNFPNAIIYVGWTPMGGLQGGSSEYITRMHEVCLMYGVEYIETRTCGVTRFSDVYAECYESGVNGGHPTTAGQQKIGAYMTRLMQSKR